MIAANKVKGPTLFLFQQQGTLDTENGGGGPVSGRGGGARGSGRRGGGPGSGRRGGGPGSGRRGGGLVAVEGGVRGRQRGVAGDQVGRPLGDHHPRSVDVAA